MGSSATTTNQAAGVVDSVLRELVNLGTTALETAATAYVPFLGAPVVKQVFDYIVGWIGDIFYKAIALDGTYLVLRFQTAVEKSNYSQAVLDLKAAQASGNDLQLTAARLAFDKAASSLIHSDGSFSP